MTVVGAVGVALFASGGLALLFHGLIHFFTGRSTYRSDGLRLFAIGACVGVVLLTVDALV